MHRTVHPGSFMVVEGPDDHRFWKNFVVAGDCEMVLAHGRPNLLSAMSLLAERAFSGVVAVADDDHDSLRGVLVPAPNTVVTDGTDLEAMLLMGPALDRVLSELGDEAKVTRLERRTGRPVREQLFEKAVAWGRLRALARHGEDAIDFSALRPPRFLDPVTWDLDEDALIKAACAAGLAGDEEALHARLATAPGGPPHRVAQGHDLVRILVAGLRGPLGDRKTSEVGEQRVAQLLRVGTADAFLETTSTWADLGAWEAVHRRRVRRSSG